MLKGKNKSDKMMMGKGPTGFVFFWAWVGALVYFVQVAQDDFWNVILALLKSIVWPAYVVHAVLKLLHI
ncbi:MAG TPA: hypothetical protein VLF39_00095 [Candidatus Saccharimonadales bacterium]|nr:hypothetical protein [Candidatus Saccharimonadales bacterium]